jgi:leucyl aminopeptidase
LLFWVLFFIRFIFTLLLGAMKGIIELGMKINVVGCVALAENAISEKAYKPSDVLTSLNGNLVKNLKSIM